MTRQEEADAILKYLAEEIHWDEAKDKAIVYVDKYLKPKNPLFEKWKKLFANIHLHKSTAKESFEWLKENFAEELNGTKGLDEAMEKLSYHQYGSTVLKEIKERLEK